MGILNMTDGSPFSTTVDYLMANISEFLLDETDACGEDRSLLDQPYIRYTFWCLYILVFVACLIGNLFTILVLCTHPQMRTPTNFFLANLAGADLLVALFCILQNMIHILGHENGNWFFGEAICRVYLFVLHMVPCTSVGILMCVSIEKYIAVLHPLVALKTLTKRLRTMLAIGVWSVSLIANFPFLKTAQLYKFGDFSACARDHEYSLEPLVVASFVLWYVIPVITLAFIYTRIGLVLWKSGDGISNRASTESQTSNNGGASWLMSSGRVIVYQQNSLLQVPDREQRRANEKRREVKESRRKVIRLLFVIVLSFAVFTLPNHFRLLHSTFSKSHTCLWHWSNLFQPLSYLSLFFSSTINPILYAFLSRRFRLAAQDVLRCRCSLLGLTTSSDDRSRGRTVLSSFDESSPVSRAQSRSPSFSFVQSVRVPLLVATMLAHHPRAQPPPPDNQLIEMSRIPTRPQDGYKFDIPRTEVTFVP